MDQELKAYLDEQFARQGLQLWQQGGRLKRLEEEGRQTRVLLEDIRSDIRLIAEGLVSMSERLEAHKGDMNKGFQDVKASIAPAYQDLDRRLQFLEAREERRERDILEVVREKFSIPRT